MEEFFLQELTEVGVKFITKYGRTDFYLNKDYSDLIDCVGVYFPKNKRYVVGKVKVIHFSLNAHSIKFDVNPLDTNLLYCNIPLQAMEISMKRIVQVMELFFLEYDKIIPIGEKDKKVES